MRKLIVLEHVSLDGYLGGLKGEMDWIKFDEELFDDVAQATDISDTAVYGRITFEMMEGYWPTAAENPKASKHTIHHSKWVNEATKILISRTVTKSDWAGTKIISDNLTSKIEGLKKESGKNILLIGSPSIVHALTNARLIDEYWLNINPVILGNGIPMFKNDDTRTELKLISSKQYKCGVIGARYNI